MTTGSTTPSNSFSSKVQLFQKASRAQVLPVMVMPVLAGTAAAFAWYHIFHLWWFLLTLLGAAAMHLFSNMINDLWDYRNGADSATKESTGTIPTNSGLLVSGVMSEKRFAALTWGLFFVALVSGLALAYFRTPWVLFFGVLGALLAYFYVAPPIQYGYRGKGYSEVSILISFGVLPVLGSFFVQTLQYDVRAILVSLPIGILTTLILFNHHFLHWQADKLAGKRTLVVVLGEKRALYVSRSILILACLSLILGVLLHALPIYALIALVTMIRPWKVYQQLADQNPPQAYLPLMGTSFGASVQCGLLIILSLVVQGFVG